MQEEEKRLTSKREVEVRRNPRNDEFQQNQMALARGQEQQPASTKKELGSPAEGICAGEPSTVSCLATALQHKLQQQ